MPIVSSVITYDKKQGNGLRSINERHTDHVGETYTRVYYLPVGEDVTPILADHAVKMTASLRKGEIHKLVRSVENGDEDGIAPDLTHNTQQQAWRGIIKAMRAGRARFAINALPLMQHINANFTDAQILNALGITQLQLTTLRIRMTKLVALKTDIDADDALVIDDG